jgi:hypothetical protein
MEKHRPRAGMSVQVDGPADGSYISARVTLDQWEMHVGYEPADDTLYLTMVRSETGMVGETKCLSVPPAVLRAALEGVGVL